MHMNAHERGNTGGSVEFMCDRRNCGKIFHRQSHLQRHLNLHDNIVERCYFCPWVSPVLEKMIIHLDQHLNTPKFTCDMCGEQFFRNSVLKDHFERHHERFQEKYKCKYCDYKTHCSMNLNWHNRRNHKIK